MNKFALSLFLVTVLVGYTQDNDKTAPISTPKLWTERSSFLVTNSKSRNLLFSVFLSTWCGPCRIEIPVLNKLKDEYPGISFYLVDVSNLEQGGVKLTEDPDEVRKMIESMNVTMTVLMDKYGVAAESYGALELPKTVVIDRGGEIVYEKTGYKRGDENALIKVLKELEHAEK